MRSKYLIYYRGSFAIDFLLKATLAAKNCIYQLYKELSAAWPRGYKRRFYDDPDRMIWVQPGAYLGGHCAMAPTLLGRQ